MPGNAISEVTNISHHGFWVFLGDRELFLPFEEFPWFKEAPVDSDPQCRAAARAPSVLAQHRCGSHGRIHRVPRTLPPQGNGRQEA